jgi:hypothetical protein
LSSAKNKANLEGIGKRKLPPALAVGLWMLGKTEKETAGNGIHCWTSFPARSQVIIALILKDERLQE